MNDNRQPLSGSFALPQCTTHLALFLFVSLTAVPAAAEDGLAGTLHWSNGDQLLGQLIDANPTHLHWKSPLFADPFELNLKHLLSVRFEQTEQLNQTEPIRFITQSGDVLYGQLISISDGHLLLESKRHGKLRISQSQLRTFRRLTDTGLVYLGPTGLSGWKTVNVKRRTTEWEADTEGWLSTKVLGAELFRDLKLPEISEIELVLQWKRRPGFQIIFADPRDLRLSQETVRLETWEDELVLQTLAGNGDFEQLLTLGKGQNTLELRLLWNQRSGELAVYSEHGELLGKMTAGPDTGQNRAGLYLKNRGSDLTLAKLRVSNWSGMAPTSKQDENASCVRLVSGTLMYGQILSYDRQARALVVRSEGQSQRIPIDKISSVFFGTDSDADSDRPSAMLSYYDGTLLRGSLEAISAGSIRLKTNYCAAPITASLRGARRLQLFTPTEAAPTSDAVLQMNGLKLHGRLAPAGPSGKELGWQPFGSNNSSPLKVGGSARIVREIKANEDFMADGASDVLYLRNGDVLPCRVKSIDDAHLLLDPIFVEEARLPLTIVKAIEFGADAFLPSAGFASKNWVVTENQRGTVERTDKQVVFHGQATLGHRSIMHGDEVGFDMRWNSKTPVAMTVGLNTPDAKRVSSPSVLVYCVQQQLFVRGIRGGHQLIQAGRMRNALKAKRARLKFRLANRKLEVFVNQTKVLGQALNDRHRLGKGLVLSVQRLDGARRNAARKVNQDELLIISDFRVGRTAGPFGSLEVDSDRKDVLLTLPRNRKQNPPTHVLVARNGDVLRGRLLELNDQSALFTSRLDDFAFSRKRLAGIIWLEKDGAEPPRQPEKGVHAQVVFANGATLSFNADSMVQEKIGGTHPILGTCMFPRTAIRELRIGTQPVGDISVAYSDWELRPAKEPQFAGGSPNDPGGATPGLDSPLIGTDATDFQAKLLDGTDFRLADHSDKVVILDFWATWCGPCVKAMPQIIKTVEAFPREQVLLVTVNQQENAKVIREFLESRGWEMTVALDRDGKIGRQYNVEAIPQTVIVGRGGKIERLHVGSQPEFQQELSTVLQKLVAAKEPAGAE